MSRGGDKPYPKKKPKFITPPNVLRQKCGKGGLQPLVLQRAEEFIDENQLEFGPYALEIMKRLDAVVDDCRAGRYKGKTALDMLTRPIMELKANGGMFKFMLVSQVADIVLTFLENINDVNEDVYEIIQAHQNTLSAIITNGLKGGGGREGVALSKELHAACQRYYKKHAISVA